MLDSFWLLLLKKLWRIKLKINLIKLRNQMLSLYIKKVTEAYKKEKVLNNKKNKNIRTKNCTALII